MDFRDEPEPEIQFVTKSVSRDFKQGEQTREETTGVVGTDVDKAISFQERGGKPGGGKGILIQEDHVGALSTLNNQAVLNSSGDDICGTLDASYYKGCGERQGIEREVLCVGNGQLNQTISSECAGSLNYMHEQQAVITFSDTHNALNADDGPKGIHSQMLNAPESNFVVEVNFQSTKPYCIGSGQTHDAMKLDPVCKILNTLDDVMKVLTVDQGGGKSQVNVSEDLTPTLTTTHGGEPVICLEGNGARESHKGDELKEPETMYTLDTVEQHAVAVGVDFYNQQITGDVSMTITSGRNDKNHIPCVTTQCEREGF